MKCFHLEGGNFDVSPKSNSTMSHIETRQHFYFTTKRLHEQNRVSSGQYRWLYCPLVPEGSIKFSVMPAGK